MENIRTIRVYNLVDSKGNRLRLELGIIRNFREEKNTDPMYNGDLGYRWRFCGKNIPMPVRSRTWFNGFPEPIMIPWLKGNGWFPHTRVEMCDGYAEVFELPKANEEDENPLVSKAITRALQLLWCNGNHINAIHLYRHFYGGTLDEAQVAVKGIVDYKA